MFHLLRNPEIKRTFSVMLLISALFIGAGFYYAPQCGYLLATACFLFLVVFVVSTARRYRKLQKLAAELDSMLHFQTPIPFEAYREGELSILQNELSKMTLRLVEQAENLEKDKTYLSNAMADISHQLRSPLTSSQLIASLLREPDLTPEKRMELLSELTQLLSRINWLIETLLKMSKMDAKTAYLKKEPVSVAELLRRSSEPFLIPMELHSQTLVIRQEDPSLTFTGDLSWSMEAIMNILKNCMEHIPEGGQITITAHGSLLYTELIIQDDGCGFLQEDLPHIFERFYKGKNSGSQSVGIGLALARMIINEQNGTVKASNAPEGGAKFVIRFYQEITV